MAHGFLSIVAERGRLVSVTECLICPSDIKAYFCGRLDHLRSVDEVRS